ncbi:MAG: UDP-N-acetylmuramoyl-L-alanine--D-glutamate ligase [Clostridia bacterium]|nr:UDP-N-acetylmuramoyl-L-alanine--D-glutamate ligase [Lachnospiraceae bacterium]NCC00072.1 UDP-N-acetylmuramoyl-L-alanine--D-glutamate ligase [Clostridia bacterium]NCD01916.1 UDP-N-acetylmuramoyl-L-alanine--D-glutamate ligase [Clostridia bacterium]
MDFKNKTVLVAGTGISGIGAAELLMKTDVELILYDGNRSLTASSIQAKLPESKNIKIIIGDLSDEVIQTLDIAVLSPGIPTDAEFVLRMKNAGVLIWGELELADQFAKGTVLAITGTNGKTTTTTLVGEILKNYYKEVYVVGNIGTAYAGVAKDTTDEAYIVAETSSFQLETIDDFHPKVSAILNLTPDHLNRHHTMEGYVEAKKNIMKNQTAEDFVILNYDDPLTRAIGETAVPQVIYFSSTQVLEKGYYFADRKIFYCEDGEKKLVCSASGLKILGLHNMENIMAAVAMARCVGVPMDKIRETITSFMGVEHRIEYVMEKRGVAYYNDSKGTNPDAAIKAIQAMVRPTILIGGGYDKESSYDEWIEAFDNKVRYLVLLGATANKIAECARRHGYEHIIMTESLEEAVKVCAEKAENGDAVLLSPACASWDMFKSYEQRGTLFKEYVNKLAD